MGKNVLITTILVFLIVVDVSNAAFTWNFRKLIAPSPKEDPNVTVAPIPSPASDVKKSSPVVGGDEKAKEKGKQSSPPSTSEHKPVENNTVVSPPPSGNKEESKDPKKDVKDGGKDESKSNVPVVENESCEGKEWRCQDTKSLVACIRSLDDVSKTFVLLIQNEGNSSLNVDIKIPPSKHMQNTIEIPKLQSKKVEILLPNEGANTVKLNAGNGDCVLRVGGAPASQGNFFQKLPSYSKFMTPIYGAYFLLATTLIAASVAACCWFRRKRRPGGDVAYQELEMAAPESAVAAAESAEGWDQVWDDDWDEEKAVKSPGGRNISANGLTARNAKKDGWEDWDD